MSMTKVNKLIFASSAAVYGAPKTKVIEETHVQSPCNVYGMTKSIDEKIIANVAKQFNINYLIFRFFNVSGASDSLTYGCLVSLNNEIHALGGDGTYTRHKKWNGSSWVTVSTLPFGFYRGSALVYNTGASDEIILLGSAYTGNQNKVAQWDGSSWTVATE
jgi:hypothetical protein